MDTPGDRQVGMCPASRHCTQSIAIPSTAKEKVPVFKIQVDQRKKEVLESVGLKKHFLRFSSKGTESYDAVASTALPA